MTLDIGPVEKASARLAEGLTRYEQATTDDLLRTIGKPVTSAPRLPGVGPEMTL